MQGQLIDGTVEVGANARERYYDSRGYGRPRGDGVVLSRVEAAHLLYRGDLDAVDGQDFAAFLAQHEDIVVDFLVYRDLRDRGFYLSPARDGWVDDPADIDFVVHPRGDGPWDDTVEHRVSVVGERASIPLASLGDVVLAVVDEESEITYLDTDDEPVAGESSMAFDGSTQGHLLEDRVLCWEPPTDLYERGFYGQQMGRDDDTLQLSLLEATYLAETGHLNVDGGAEALLNRGRAVEGERFDRRLTVYRELRERGLVPKTGFKFGADFRTYADVESVEELGHSELLIRVLPADEILSPRDLALDVRLAHGVRKEMVYALVDGNGDMRWVSVARLTP
ncbi:tRNA-intron lyase [Natronomonas halophila]|uniref:tRNA-intron lyase n=1 Tax=Natronomonas halophila TaxID=2747817 RepID=UPI0015B6FFF5|nr:tRNA-intron lyase [Natronomonas halophila]QLD86020.1 tRNA-intron lyase [Natronomonas halophila]